MPKLKNCVRNGPGHTNLSFAHYHGQHEDLRMEDHKDFQRETAPSLVDTKEVEELRNMLEETYSIHKEMVKTHGSVTGRQGGDIHPKTTSILGPNCNIFDFRSNPRHGHLLGDVPQTC